jgi:hypothetical protein
MITGASPRSIFPFPPSITSFTTTFDALGSEAGAMVSLRALRGADAAVTALGRSAMTAQGPLICT